MYVRAAVGFFSLNNINLMIVIRFIDVRRRRHRRFDRRRHSLRHRHRIGVDVGNRVAWSPSTDNCSIIGMSSLTSSTLSASSSTSMIGWRPGS